MLKAINWFYPIYWYNFCNNYYWLKVGFFVMQADFFVTYILTSGLSGFSLEILQPVLLSWDLLKSCICCSGKEKEAYLYSLPHSRIIPFISLFLLIGMVYAVVAPLLLPFLIGYFCLGYVVYVNQVNLSLVFYPRWAFLSFCVLCISSISCDAFLINVAVAWFFYLCERKKWVNWYTYGEHWSTCPFCRRCATGLNWPGQASSSVTLKGY